jgi:hypothetical protein
MVWVKIEPGMDITGPARNFATGIILPRATPAWSGTTHSMSSMPRAASQVRASSSDFTPLGVSEVWLTDGVLVTFHLSFRGR